MTIPVPELNERAITPSRETKQLREKLERELGYEYFSQLVQKQNEKILSHLEIDDNTPYPMFKEERERIKKIMERPLNPETPIHLHNISPSRESAKKPFMPAKLVNTNESNMTAKIKECEE